MADSKNQSTKKDRPTLRCLCGSDAAATKVDAGWFFQCQTCNRKGPEEIEQEEALFGWNAMQANIAIKANVWASEQHQEGDPRSPSIYTIQDLIPGDLMVNIIGTRDSRILPKHLNRKQMEEYLHYRFFQPHGQEGKAVEDL